MNQKENRLLHLAVAVGYARFSLKIAERADLVDGTAFSKAHLDRPAFAELSPKARSIAEFEIFELVKDGGLLPNQGSDFIASVVAGDYAPCWQLANRALLTHNPGYPNVEPIEIDPALLR